MTPPVSGPDEGLNAAVAAELRAEQARQRMSIAALAEVADIPYGSLRRYLSAERHIDVSVLAAMASALGVEPGELVTRAKVVMMGGENIVEGRFGAGRRREDMQKMDDEAARDE